MRRYNAVTHNSGGFQPPVVSMKSVLIVPGCAMRHARAHTRTQVRSWIGDFSRSRPPAGRPTGANAEKPRAANERNPNAFFGKLRKNIIYLLRSCDTKDELTQTSHVTT